MIATGPVPFDSHLSAEHWPACYKCSEKLGTKWPVEVFGIIARERPTVLRSRHKLVVEVGCTGQTLVEHVQYDLIRGTTVGLEKAIRAVGWKREHGDLQQRIALEAMREWGPTTEQLACARLIAFAPGAPGKHGVLYQPGPNRKRHGMETQVR